MTKKEVKLYDRVFCILVSFSVASLFILYSFRPISAGAYGEPDPASIIKTAYDYSQNYIHNMIVIEHAIQHDLDTGNLDATSSLAKQVGLAVLLQKLMTLDNDLIIQEANNTLFYQQFEENWDNIPDSYTVASDVCSSGYCQDTEGGYHYVMLIAKNDIIYQSDLFTIKVNDLENPHDEVKVKKVTYAAPPNDRVTMTFNPSTLEHPHFYDSLSYFDTDVTFTSSKTLWILVQPNSSTIPVINPANGLSEYIHSYSSSKPGRNMMGNGGKLSLSSETVNKSTPWTYYNNVMLPYIQEHYPDVYNNYKQYLVFPNGYIPRQDPTEPPLPDGNNAGIGVTNNWNFNIGINNITVTDASGQPVTDASGETVTETVIQTESRPTDAVYNFQIPTLTPLETQVATIPPYEVPAEYAGYMGDIFSSITTFINDAGLTDVAPVFLALAGIGIVIGVLL